VKCRDKETVRSYHSGMPMWRCPHCGTPQAETARCWVCHRSSTACATCKNFRRSVAGQLGYCGLDRERRPLRGDEIQGCWEASAAPIEVVAMRPGRPGAAPTTIELDRTPVRKLEFVEVKSSPVKAGVMSAAGGTAETEPGIGPRAKVRRRGKRDSVAGAGGGAWPLPSPAITEAAAEPPLVSQAEPGWSLWGDLEV
jgi:hypothetical protein